MNTAIFRDKLQSQTNIGMWLSIILVEISLAAIATLFPIKYAIIIFIGIPLVFYLFAKPFHAYLFTILMLPFWTVTLSGVGGAENETDIRYTQIAVAIAALSWLFNGLIRKKLYFEKSVLNFPIAILLGWMLISFLWVINVYLGVKDFLLTIYGVIVFFLTINSVKDEKTLNITIKTWIIMGLFCALMGLSELIGSAIPAIEKLSAGRTLTVWARPTRIAGFKESTHRLGFLMNVCLMITVPQLIITKSRKYKNFLIFCVFCMLGVLMNTMSRSSWAGCFAGIACCSFYSKRLAKILLISSLVALVLFMTIAPEPLQQAVTGRFEGLLNPTETRSIIARSGVWKAGIRMFADHPITGVGIGAFPAISEQYGADPATVAPHDIYLYFLAHFGLIGLSIFLFLVFTIMSSIIKGLNRISNVENKFVLFGLFVALIIYFFQGLVVNFKFYEMEMWLLLGLAMATLKIFTSQEEKTKGAVAPANKSL